MESVVRARIDNDIKEVAEANLKKMGLTPSSAIRLFYYAVAEEGRIPFEIRVPNATTLRAFKELEEGKGLKAKSVDDLMDQLNA